MANRDILAIGTSAGGFEALRTVASGEPDQPLGGAQVVEDAVGEELLDDAAAGRPDALGLVQAPLGVAALVGEMLGRQVLVDGGTLSGAVETRVRGDEGMLAEQLHGGFARTQPQRLVDETVGCGVVGLLEADVAVGMDLERGPHGEFGGAHGQRVQECTFGLDEAGERSLAGRRGVRQIGSARMQASCKLEALG